MVEKMAGWLFYLLKVNKLENQLEPAGTKAPQSNNHTTPSTLPNSMAQLSA